ncbi:MAG: type II secretion system protein [Nitrospinae bacterium]|nr:type II secretion system protein [Nitrospinota bacterium]
MKSEAGFTLIELIMVIVILGILAAVAIPKFQDLSSSASKNAAAGVTGALRSTIVTLHSKYILDGGTFPNYKATDVINNTNAQGITLTAASATQITGTINANVCSWTYTDNTNTTTLQDAVTGVAGTGCS